MVSTGDGFADTLIERVKGISGMNETVQAVVLTHTDAAIQAIVNAIPGLEHWAPARKGGVVANEAQFGT